MPPQQAHTDPAHPGGAATTGKHVTGSCCTTAAARQTCWPALLPSSTEE